MPQRQQARICFFGENYGQMTPDISIILPIYNTSKFLPKCLDSILGQRFQNLEILLVDDGSTDDSLEILLEYAKKEKRIRVLHQENSGVSSARNLGLREATGKWVAFVDSDDWLEQEYLEKLWMDADDVDFVLCGMNLIDRKGALRPVKLRTKEMPLAKNDVYTLKEIYNSLNMYAFCGPVCKLFRRDIIETHSILFPEELVFGEDSVFVARYLHHIRKLRIVDQPLYNVQSREGSLCATIPSPALLLNSYRRVHLETLSFCRAQGVEDMSSQESYYVDRLLFCADKMKRYPFAKSLREERANCYNYVYHSPYKNKSGNKLPLLFYFCGALRWWRLYDFVLSISFHG